MRSFVKSSEQSTSVDFIKSKWQQVCVCVYLQIGGEWIREPHVAWEGTEDEVAELDAVGWDNITEAVMVVTQELWEVMQQDQEHSQCALKQPIIIQ